MNRSPTAPPEPKPHLREARALLAERARTFRIASWFLPVHMRDDAAIVYAFCRMVDDAADEAESPRAGRQRLAEIRAMLEGAAEPTALVREYVLVAERLGFGLDPARALLAGAESDLGRVRVENDAELLTYCYRVAGTVGLMMCGVLGVESQVARGHAVQLGIAMQITNICRDVREDAELGRVYLPRRRLSHQGLAAEDAGPLALLLAPPKAREAVARAVRDLLADAERIYDLGARGFQYIPARPRLAIIVAARLYRGIGQRLNRRGGDALEGRTLTPAWEKLSTVLASLGDWLTGVVLPKSPLALLGRSLPGGRSHGGWLRLSASHIADPARTNPR